MTKAFTRTILFVLILGTVFSISFAVNSLFTYVRDEFLNYTHQRLLASFLYFILLIVLLVFLLLGYKHVTNKRKIHLQKLLGAAY